MDPVNSQQEDPRVVDEDLEEAKAIGDAILRADTWPALREALENLRDNSPAGYNALTEYGQTLLHYELRARTSPLERRPTSRADMNAIKNQLVENGLPFNGTWDPETGTLTGGRRRRKTRRGGKSRRGKSRRGKNGRRNH